MVEEAYRQMSDRTSARMMIVGSTPLTEGFALIGFETFPEITTKDFDALLTTLINNREQALIVLEEGVVRLENPLLDHVRMEGGGIVLIEIPSLSDQHNAMSHSDMEEVILRLMGPTALENQGHHAQS